MDDSEDRMPSGRRHNSTQGANKSANPRDAEGTVGPVSAPDFFDVPTSTENGKFIAYFDVMLWISERLGADVPESDQWDEAEKRISLLWQKGTLQPLGFRFASGHVEEQLSPIPSEAQPSLYIDVTRGQPAWDLERHGARHYGLAWWRDPNDAAKHRSEAWTGVCFRKAEVLRRWPKMSRRTRLVSEESAACEALKSQFEQRELRREEAFEWCLTNGFDISRSGFQNRVWPKARKMAGLEPKALPGRPSENR